MPKQFTCRICVVVSVLLLAASSSAQTKQPGDSRTLPLNKFIARVLRIEPFMIEVLPDSDSLVDPAYVGYGQEINPQSSREEVKRFNEGDIISGEWCRPFLFQECAGHQRVSELDRPTVPDDPLRCLGIPPSIAINLRRLPNSLKKKYEERGVLFYYKYKDLHTTTSLYILRDGRIVIDKIYSADLVRTLSSQEMRILKRLYSEGDFASEPYDRVYLEPRIVAYSPRFQSLSIKKHESTIGRLVKALDDIRDGFFRSASYTIKYQNRLEIKDGNTETFCL